MQQKTLQEVRKEAERLQRQGKNAQHDNISAVRRRTKTSARQLAVERSNLLLHGDMSTTAPDEPTDGVTGSVSDQDETIAVEKLQSKIKNIVDEFVSIKDLSEAVACIKELPSSTGPPIAEHMMNMALEAKDTVRITISDLLCALYENHAVSSTSVEAGFQVVLEFLDDIRIDIPLVHRYAGFVLGRMVAAGCFGLSYLERSCQHLVSFPVLMYCTLIFLDGKSLGRENFSCSTRGSESRK